MLRVRRAGDGGTPATAERERERERGREMKLESLRMIAIHLIYSYPITEPLGAVRAVGDLSLQERRCQKETSREEPSGRKERRNTVRLFGTNSLKEGAV
jgi:hypothetical protein